jgi:hypothetical protein
MSFEAWNLVATLGTFLVIAVTAIAALVQLHHLRTSNQLQAFLSLGLQYRDVAPMIGFVYNELPKKMESAQFREEIGAVLDPQVHPELIVSGFFDMLGGLVRYRMMDEPLVLDFAGGTHAILKCWKNLGGVIEIRRRHAPAAYENFEYLAARAQQWNARFPNGTYPAAEPRMPLPVSATLNS